MNFIPEKVQSDIFEKVCSLDDNKECSDCSSKHPTWSSIDFGVLICMKCAGIFYLQIIFNAIQMPLYEYKKTGIHRGLGTNTTRVKSIKLDKWTFEWIDIVENIGNRLANDYYEYKMPRALTKPGLNSSDESRRRQNFFPFFLSITLQFPVFNNFLKFSSVF